MPTNRRTLQLPAFRVYHTVRTSANGHAQDVWYCASFGTHMQIPQYVVKDFQKLEAEVEAGNVTDSRSYNGKGWITVIQTQLVSPHRYMIIWPPDVPPGKTANTARKAISDQGVIDWFVARCAFIGEQIGNDVGDVIAELYEGRGPHVE